MSQIKLIKNHRRKANFKNFAHVEVDGRLIKIVFDPNDPKDTLAAAIAATQEGQHVVGWDLSLSQTASQVEGSPASPPEVTNSEGENHGN